MQMERGDQELVRQLPGNSTCADCSTRAPQWASVTYGSLHCLECSGAHRGLGVHLSFVRSVTMDTWSEKQVKMMKLGGNGALKAWWREHGVPESATFSQRYGSPAAKLYADRLVAKVEGRPLPTELPKVATQASTVYDSASSRGSGMSAGGFSGGGGGGGSSGSSKGVEPLSGESENDYVARQRALQEEARERMRAKFGGGGLGGVGSDTSYDASTGRYGSGLPLDVDAISGGIKRLGSSAVDVVGSLRDAEAVQRTKDTVKDLWGATVRGVSSLGDNNNNSGETDEPSGWAALKGFGASIGARVSDVAKNLAAPDDGEALAFAVRNVDRGSKKMDGLGSNGFANDADLDDLLRANRGDHPGGTTSSVRDASSLPGAPRPGPTTAEPRRATSPPKPPQQNKPPKEPEKDFFESFGV
mmetsp:Transcript_20786/g.66898  ORF Transcript_20786/g.66898 Transcript_20786/m.66898 type:complete len:416 (-) Transcript_20786:427-1674(-)|eukprot:CAMPEP_0118918016 /NCGR_PEP_ID=MMETSP1166-20130328/17661_1 /TAXON_ID=1104430 /ORGANISM="Chrysoreinhardia sp, Strain CCMP3193" /LENGTH=415 /DNA_ID=CAMNT_0006858255 /DNA_START=161 /DNA_END=1408 /DNA_ORIENTATION=-